MVLYQSIYFAHLFADEQDFPKRKWKKKVKAAHLVKLSLNMNAVTCVQVPFS